MGDRVLNDCYGEAIKHHDENILKKKANGHWFGLAVDGWEAIDKSHIEGVLLKAGQETFFLQPAEIN